ncbi:Purine nucleoside phosphorylase [Extremus antarcticus]|uniref:purine-nucleoside phosphorylase n=1 Tax=Extremus antarcticus TaxID=702011 RepID=A0AAJ0DNT7_9PEZI|nr:Purine nucleoside phosphorylase [Extremus antarcticus]
MLQLLHHAASLYHSATHLRHTFTAAHDEMTDITTQPSAVFNQCVETVEWLRTKVPENLQKPRVAVVCGSGLGGIVGCLNTDDGDAGRWEGDYKTVPNFPVSTVAGHEGKLIFGTMGQQRVPVVLLVGRAHFYEGHSMSTVTYATRVCRLLGVQTMILTNAAGGLNPDYAVGDIVCLNDHLNLAGLVGFHPLRGPNAEDFGTRFPPLSNAYDISLRQLAHKAWRDVRAAAPSPRRMHEGVYAFVGGPTYETRAECRMLRTFGADVVGMSTVPEIIVARHSDMRVLAFSLVTNNAVLEPTVRADEPELQGMSREELDAYLGKGRANHAEVLHAGQQAAVDMQALVLRIVSEL